MCNGIERQRIAHTARTNMSILLEYDFFFLVAILLFRYETLYWGNFTVFVRLLFLSYRKQCLSRQECLETLDSIPRTLIIVIVFIIESRRHCIRVDRLCVCWKKRGL